VRARPWEVPDGLWERIEPMLPKRQRRFRYPGRKPLDDRLVLQGILFVLHTGIGWEHLPRELGFGCGMTAWRRYVLGSRRACGNGCTKCCCRAASGRPTGVDASDRRLQPRAGEKGRAKTGPSPVDRGRAGSKHHLLAEGGGLPLAWSLTGGNRNDGRGLRRGRPTRPRTGGTRSSSSTSWVTGLLALACCLICWRRLESLSLAAIASVRAYRVDPRLPHRSSWLPDSGSARGRGTTSSPPSVPTGMTSPRSPCPVSSRQMPTVPRSRCPTTSTPFARR
jgi:transposase